MLNYQRVNHPAASVAVLLRSPRRYSLSNQRLKYLNSGGPAAASNWDIQNDPNEGPFYEPHYTSKLRRVLPLKVNRTNDDNTKERPVDYGCSPIHDMILVR